MPACRITACGGVSFLVQRQSCRVFGTSNASPKPSSGRAYLDSPRSSDLPVNRNSVRAPLAGKSQEDVDRLLAAAEELLQQLGSPNSQQPTASPTAASDTALVLQCDVNGCTIVPRKKDEPQDAAGNLVAPLLTSNSARSKPEGYKTVEGTGWKIGFEPSPEDPINSFTAVIASSSWSLALTHEEYCDFMQLLHKLKISVATLQVCGEWGTGKAEKDEASLEMNTGRVWMQATAEQRRLSALQDMWRRQMSGQQPDANNLPNAAFALRFIITSPGKREVEGYWSPEVVLQVLDCMDSDQLEVPIALEVPRELAEAGSF